MAVDRTERIHLENAQLRFPVSLEYHLYNTWDPRLFSVSSPSKNSRDQLTHTLEYAFPFKEWRWKMRMDFDPSPAESMAVPWVSD